MILTKKALPRRTFLRGLGTAIALPLFDAMVPAASALAATAAQPVRRLGFVYFPHGAIMDQWIPTGTGKDFTFSPLLQHFEPFRDQLIVTTGLTNAQAESMGDGNGGHSRAAAVYLTGVHPKHTEGPDIHAGRSVDQVAAAVLGRETRLPSLELAIDSNDMVGNCENGYSCAYLNTISWRTPTDPNPMETDPRVVFERMFGEGGNTTQRRSQLRKDRSILDFVKDDVGHLEAQLGPSDRSRLSQYLESVRQVEQRIGAAEAQSSQSALELPTAPIGVPDQYEEHVKLMFDMLVLACRADVTRVFTFALGRELTNRTYPQIGVPDPHHGISHHNNNPVMKAKMLKVNHYHAQLSTYFLDQMKGTQDGDGNLLDHSLIVYGSGMSNGNLHSYVNLPTVILGGGSGQVKGGLGVRHLNYEEGTPISNLYVSLLDRVGVHTERFGDSTGRMQPDPLAGI